MAKRENVTFIPAEDFTGYPLGQKAEFKAGIESLPVPEAFANLMREKGHVAKGTQFHHPEPAPDAE